MKTPTTNEELEAKIEAQVAEIANIKHVLGCLIAWTVREIGVESVKDLLGQLSKTSLEDEK